MPFESISQAISNKIQKQCAPDLRKLEREKDEIKQLKLSKRIQRTALLVLLKQLKRLSSVEWEKYTEELFEPVFKQSSSVSAQLDALVYRKSKGIKEYEKYEKMKKISAKADQELIDVIDRANLNKRQLERFLVLILNQIWLEEISKIQTGLNFYEFHEAATLVQRRLGFDYNWLVCLSLIQLHENLIKKKIIELNGQIEKREPIRSLISKLSKLIKEKERREVSLALLLSNGIKEARDTMSHEGYKHPVSKQDLVRIFNEIAELERTLYPEAN